MPYKNKEQAKEASRLRKQKSRLNVTPDNVTPCTPLMSRPNTMIDGKVVFKDNKYNPDEKIYDHSYYPDGYPVMGRYWIG